LGKVALDARDFDKARQEIEAAARVTKEIYDRNPEDTDAIFNHAQSEFWVGDVFRWSKDFKSALPHWESYAELSEILYKQNPSNFSWIMERAWGANNIALANRMIGNSKLAEKNYEDAIEHFELAIKENPDDLQPRLEKSNVLAGLASLKIEAGLKEEALKFKMQQMGILESCLEHYSNNYTCRFEYAQAQSRMVTDKIVSTSKLKSTIEKSIADYEALLKYDSENRKWKTDYYLYLKDLVSLIETNEISYHDTYNLRIRLTKLATEIELW